MQQRCKELEEELEKRSLITETTAKSKATTQPEGQAGVARKRPDAASEDGAASKQSGAESPRSDNSGKPSTRGLDFGQRSEPDSDEDHADDDDDCSGGSRVLAACAQARRPASKAYGTVDIEEQDEAFLQAIEPLAGHSAIEWDMSRVCSTAEEVYRFLGQDHRCAHGVACETELEVAAIVKDIAQTYSDLGRLRKALHYFNVLLEFQRVHAKYGPLDEVCTLTMIGNIHLKGFELNEASNFFTQALKTLGWPQSRVATELSKIDARARTEPKAAFYDQFARECSAAAKCLSGLGKVQQRNSEWEQARKLFDDALALNKRCLDGDAGVAIEVARNLNSIGDVYCGLRQHEEASGKYHEALLLMQKLAETNGAGRLERTETAVEVANCHNNIGLVHLANSQFELALERHETALAIRKEVLDLQHQDLAESWGSIGLALSSLGDHSEALKKHLQCLWITNTHHGRDHLDVASCRYNIGRVYASLRKPQQAAAQFEDALRIASKLHTDPHQYVAKIRFSLDKERKNVELAAMRKAFGALTLFLEGVEKQKWAEEARAQLEMRVSEAEQWRPWRRKLMARMMMKQEQAGLMQEVRRL